MQPTSIMNVALTAIQDECLVLESLEDKKLIYWPLKNLTRPLKVGHQLTLELKNPAGHEQVASISSAEASKHATSASSAPHSNSMMMAASPAREPSDEYLKQTKLCKMLEDLVN